MNRWLAVPDLTKKNVYKQIAEKTGMSSFAVEKDWWVVQTLSAIFDLEVGNNLIFKGGTSLSKAWKLIERFSEDIDIIIDRDFLGFSGELTKSKREQLRKRAGEYTVKTIFPELQQVFVERGISGLRFNLVETTESDRDPRTIEIIYPHLIEPTQYLKPVVKIEIGCRSLIEPYTVKTISSLVDEEYAEFEFSSAPINIPTVNPERTFLEKIFLLHEEFHRTAENRRSDRLSRHLYDIFKISKTDISEKALNDKDLYQIIVEHRYNFSKVGGVNYNELQPKLINMLPSPLIMGEWKSDYETMLEQMIYEENPPSFDDMIKELTLLKERINNLQWKFDLEFPVPIQHAD